MANEDMLTGYLAGQDSGGGSGDMGWGGGWVWIILVFALLGWGGGGFGWGGAGGGAGGALTRADLCSEFNFNGMSRALNDIGNGLADGFYAQANAINGVNTNILTQANASNVANMQGFFGVERQLAANAAADANCCCQTQRMIESGFANLGYNMASQFCDTRQAIANSTRDIVDTNNANTRAILDFLTQDKLSTLQAENQTLKLAASQQAQNAILTAAMGAQTAQILNTLNPQPVPSYTVPNPNCCYQQQTCC